MCTMIVQKVALNGSGKSGAEWFHVNQANVFFDHPFNAPMDHSLNIDFVNEAKGPSARVAVELTIESAQALVETIQSVLAEADAGGHLEHENLVELVLE